MASKSKPKQFQRGDKVVHAHRGSGTFDSYCDQDPSGCYVQFDGESGPDRVRTALVKPLATWTVTRVIEETYEVEASTTDEARLEINAKGDPASVRIIRETVKRQRE